MSWFQDKLFGTLWATGYSVYKHIYLHKYCDDCDGLLKYIDFLGYQNISLLDSIFVDWVTPSGSALFKYVVLSLCLRAIGDGGKYK